MNDSTISDVNSEVPRNAVSVYSQDAGMDDFPVLKAFQQYIDAEQAKARKRLVTMGIFFAILMGAVIAVFVAMLASVSQRNQMLNDRLVEFAMRDRDRQPVVVQSPPQTTDGGMFQTLTAKLDELARKIVEQEKKAAENAVNKAEEPAKEKSTAPTPEQIEIERLKALLSAEREKAAAEKERKRQEELEAYRRKHYPDFYRQTEQKNPSRRIKASREPQQSLNADEIDDVLDLLDDNEAIDYFGSDDDLEESESSEKRNAPVRKASKKPSAAEDRPDDESRREDNAAQAKKPAQPYVIPVEVKKTRSGWRIPAE